MTHILEMFPPSKYLAAFELKGGDRTLTIKTVRAEIIEGENNRKDKRPIVYFAEDAKPLVLNKTNAKIIIKLYGPDYAAWPGKRITVYPTQVDAFGEKVEAIRLRKQVPSAAETSSTKKVLPIGERVDAFLDAIKKAADVTALEATWNHKRADDLRREVDPETLDRISLAYEGRLDELKGGGE